MILGFKAWNLPGADIGIMFYLKPRWEKLLDVTVWNDAASKKYIKKNILIISKLLTNLKLI